MIVHIDVCPDCGEATTYHPLDAPMFCTHERERFVPVRYVALDEVAAHLRDATIWNPATGRDRAVSGWRAAAEELLREFGAPV